jgi:hypothetical protein
VVGLRGRWTRQVEAPAVGRAGWRLTGRAPPGRLRRGTSSERARSCARRRAARWSARAARLPVQRAWIGPNETDPRQRAHAIHRLGNLGRHGATLAAPRSHRQPCGEREQGDRQQQPDAPNARRASQWLHASASKVGIRGPHANRLHAETPARRRAAPVIFSAAGCLRPRSRVLLDALDDSHLAVTGLVASDALNAAISTSWRRLSSPLRARLAREAAAHQGASSSAVTAAASSVLVIQSSRAQSLCFAACRHRWSRCGSSTR